MDHVISRKEQTTPTALRWVEVDGCRVGVSWAVMLKKNPYKQGTLFVKNKRRYEVQVVVLKSISEEEEEKPG